MHTLKGGRIWLLVIAMSVLAVGCGREQSGFVAPFVVSTTPANLASGVPVTSIVTATFSETMNASTINSGTFTVAPPSGVPIGGTVTYSGVTATFTPAAPLLLNTIYTGNVSIGAKDPAGNALAAGYSWTFTTVGVPTVTSTIPVNHATGVPLNQAISATFSEPMNPTSINAATFLVTGPPGATPVLGTVTYVAASNTAIFTPTINLSPTDPYSAEITVGAMSAGGLPLAGNYVWTFTTGTTTNSSTPTIIATNPASGATGVPLNQKVSATFSTAMNAATINGTTFTLAGPGGTAVAGTVTYAAGSNTALFAPTVNLTASTAYTATITNGAKDLAGNALGAGAVPNPWTFTTGTITNTASPTITLTNPANVATGVALNATVNATFSEPMDPTTLTSLTFTLDAPGGIAVAGTVTYSAASDVATFTPTSPLATTTEYTADVTTGARDLAGNPLVAGVAPNPWTFTTGAAAAPGAIDLGSAAAFGAFGGNFGITNQGINTEINNGDLGTTAASSLVTGFNDTTMPGSPPPCRYTETPLNVGVVNGEIYTAAPMPTVQCPDEGTAATALIALAAVNDATTAYNQMVALPPGINPGANLGGLTLTPGTYTAPGGSFLLTGSDLTLNAEGNANAVWVFQMADALTVGAAGAPRSVILTNGAQAGNVFWQVGSAATINGAGGGIMVGTIIAQAAITFSTANNNAPPFTVLDGRALVLTGPVTMVNTIINVP
jgi:Ice-binding-like/Bacterial Ig-like domain